MKEKVLHKKTVSMEETYRTLEDQSDKMDANQNFTYEVKEFGFVKVDLPPGIHTTTCLICNRTCHGNCAIPNNSDKARCWAMTNNYCRICPEKCYWDRHANLPFHYVEKETVVKKSYEDLKKKFVDAKSNLSNSE